ncbi:oocyte zinc finger protein XlCOF8.4-like [Aquarana catesbeiana]|uniref:oocyte zinc finger protein XlCOF8.4-like n=1 Tax=Aquarana catesbeiana TaxID=8400 RepID=UPI003CC942DB
MEKEQSHMTERILNLTLEIVYLLTGENYIAFKLSDGLVASNMMKTQNPIIEPPSYSSRKKKKVEEVTKEIVELLTGEVPIRCQDSIVYFYPEESNYLGHEDLEKVIIMENKTPNTSPDESSNRNPPKRCPRPLYSRNSTQEDQVTLEVYQIDYKTEVKVEADAPYVMGDEPCEEDEIPPEISTDPRQTQRDVKDGEEEEEHVRIKEEEVLIEIGMDGQQILKKKEEFSILFPGNENYITLSSQREDHITPSLHPALPSADRLSDASTPGENFPDHLPPLTHHIGHGKFLCYVCGKCFTRKESLTLHQRSHTGEKPHSCSVCGKCFLRKWCLINHERTHTGEKPYSCTECGKHFMHKSNLAFHQRTHTGVPATDLHKPYSCPECGKCFKVNAGLLLHQRTHTGVKPYSCLECGKCFSMSSALVKHKRIHTGEKPYSCSECGKSFSQRTHLVLHERTHTGVKPYSCEECGKCFTASSALAKHKRTHTGEKPYSCTVCGRGFARKENLVVHLKIHTR